MNQLEAMRVFLRVAESGSFGAAAASLDRSNAVISRYVALLESHLDARLVNRTTRCLSLTEAGRAYADGCRALLAQLDQIESGVGRAAREPHGTLKLVASASFSLDNLTPLLHAYRASYPQVRLHLTLSHRPVDLVEDGYDAGIVVPHLVSSGSLVSRPLLTIAAVTVATPEYLARHGTPALPAALVDHAFIAPSSEVRGNNWTFVGPSGEHKLTLEPVYATNNLQMIRQAVLASMGIAVLPSNLVASAIGCGALQRLFPGYVVRDADKKISLVYPGRHLSARTRSFVEFTLAYLRPAGSELQPAGEWPPAPKR
jgi:DNA-binding transcriptional LysR family regulator